jgi:hypothetical protein
MRGEAGASISALNGKDPRRIKDWQDASELFCRQHRPSSGRKIDPAGRRTPPQWTVKGVAHERHG